jgi:LysM repeat protein
MPGATATRAVPAAPGTSQAATPVIIATATPTATPVTHVVAEGETLLSIALDYGVSLEALQAANPTIEARFLSVGAVLVVPPPEGEAAVAATQLAVPPPAAVVFGEPACYQPTGTRLYCFIEARNPGNLPLENVSARVTLAGADGLPFATGIAYAGLDLVPVGGAAPLAVSFAAPPAAVAATFVEALTADALAEPEAARTQVLAIPQHVPAAGAATERQWSVSGEVQNPSDTALGNAWVTLTLYDGDGAIVGYRKQLLGQGLAPGEARPFTIRAQALAGPVERYLVAGEGKP